MHCTVIDITKLIEVSDYHFETSNWLTLPGNLWYSDY